MYTVTHPLIDTKTGEPVTLAFHITNRAGAPLDVSAGSAVYKIARRAGETAILNVTGDDIMLDGTTVTVSFNTGDIAQAGTPLMGDFLGQLTLTLDGVGLVVAEGPISIRPVIV